MKVKNNKNLIIIAAFILIYIVFISLLYLPEVLLVKLSDKITKIENFKSISDPENNLNYKLIKTKDKGIYIFKAQFEKKDLKGHDYKIFISRLTSQWFKIYVNDILIGSCGDYNTENNNIWNSVKIFDVDRQLLKDKNELSIELYALYEFGLSSIPVIIGESKAVLLLYRVMNTLLHTLNIILSGILFYGFIIIFILSISLSGLRKTYLYFSFACLFMIINTADYMTFAPLIIPVIFFKKITFLSLYLSISFISLGLGKLLNNRIIALAGIVLASVSSLLIILAADIIWIKEVSKILNVMIIINISSWLVVAFLNYIKEIKNKIRQQYISESKLMIFCSSFMILSGIHDVYMILSNKIFPFSMIIIAGYVFFISLISLIILHIINLQNKLNNELNKNRYMDKIQKKNDELRNQSIVLKTEVAVREYMEKQLKESEERFRTMTELLPSIVCETDSDYKIKYLNKTGFEILGYSDDKLNAGISFFKILDANLESKVREDFKHISTNGSILNTIYKLKTGNGDILPAFISAANIKRKNHGIRLSMTPLKKLILSAILPGEGFYDTYGFTPREREIITLVVQGFHTRDIIDKIFIAESTFKTHMSHIYSKIGINKKAELFDKIKEYQTNLYGYDSFMIGIISSLINK